MYSTLFEGGTTSEKFLMEKVAKLSFFIGGCTSLTWVLAGCDKFCSKISCLWAGTFLIFSTPISCQQCDIHAII